MSRYGRAAVKAVEYIIKGNAATPSDAWQKAVYEEFDKESSRDKRCPRIAFLGLCEDGWIKGIQKNSIICNGEKNKKYAINAAKILLRKKGNISKGILWRGARKCVNDPAKYENGQISVVLALWENRNIVDEEPNG